jgi:hypothetical protein
VTPQPMSDAEIRRLSDEADIEWGKAVGGPMPYELFARAILAARDAQWVAMLGEPVAWRAADNGGSFVSHYARQQNVFYRQEYTTPLYAIKEPK